MASLRKWFALLIFLTFDLMVLGAGVRAMDAGLTCPDWPLCFGRVVPAYHLGVYLEFIHRAIAGLVALIFVYLLFRVLKNSALKHLRFAMVIAGLLLLSQIIMGGLTVLNLLAYWTVTTHLSLATAFLATLIYIRFQLSDESLEEAHTSLNYGNGFSGFILLGLLLVAGQMVLGGLVASTYSGLVCVDFPTCNGQWIPALTGVIGLQVWHRFGAYNLVLFLSALFFAARAKFNREEISRATYGALRNSFYLILAQVLVGVLNLYMMIPPWLTVIHSALAILIFVNLLRAYLSNQQFADHHDLVTLAAQ